MKRALVSVFDKTGIVEFAQGLCALDYEILSTGSTYKLLKESGVNKLVAVEDFTGFPEMMDGRVKTLHPRIHGGILAMRANSEHMRQAKEHNLDLIDMVVCNLYPFRQTVSQEHVELAEAIEKIDIGGPSMLRAAAKNYQDVASIIDPEDYVAILEELKAFGDVQPETKFRLCAKVFTHTAHYDTMVSNYLNEKAHNEPFRDIVNFTFERVQDMHYGENPHQKAAFYREIMPVKGSITGIEKLHGRELSFNNINDANGALALLKEFDEPAVVASKHANPCGVGTGTDIYEAYSRAYKSDPVSIFGGIIALNRAVDEKTALLMSESQLDIIIAPGFSLDALNILTKKKNTRLLTLPDIAVKQQDNALEFKKVIGGLIVQTIDNTLFPEDKTIQELPVVTARRPTESEYADLTFAWKIVKHTKSNAIAIGKNGQSVGIGCGQVNRIWPTKQAIEHAIDALGKDSLKSAAMASDAYFPFDDCVEAAAAAGVTAIIQPGGSIRDKDSIAACDKHGIAMVFTRMRHFKH